MTGEHIVFMENTMSEEEAVQYFFELKWPNGFICPHCGHTRAYTIKSRRLPLLQCKQCRHQSSLIAGTVMEGSRTALSKWAVAMQLLLSETGVNAVHLSQIIRVTYKTAWAMLRKIRQAIHTFDSHQPLAGIVRAGFAFYGRNYLHQPYVRHDDEYPIIVGSSFQPDGSPVYVKIKVAAEDHLDNKRLTRFGSDEFIKAHVKEGTWDIRVLKRFQINEAPFLPQLVKEAIQWINGTFHGIGGKYLQLYWDEFCFRVNQNFSKHSARDTLARICLSSNPATSERMG